MPTGALAGITALTGLSIGFMIGFVACGASFTIYFLIKIIEMRMVYVCPKCDKLLHEREREFSDEYQSYYCPNCTTTLTVADGFKIKKRGGI